MVKVRIRLGLGLSNRRFIASNYFPGNYSLHFLEYLNLT